MIYTTWLIIFVIGSLAHRITYTPTPTHTDRGSRWWTDPQLVRPNQPFEIYIVSPLGDWNDDQYVGFSKDVIDRGGLTSTSEPPYPSSVSACQNVISPLRVGTVASYPQNRKDLIKLSSEQLPTGQYFVCFSESVFSSKWTAIRQRLTVNGPLVYTVSPTQPLTDSRLVLTTWGTDLLSSDYFYITTTTSVTTATECETATAVWKSQASSANIAYTHTTANIADGLAVGHYRLCYSWRGLWYLFPETLAVTEQTSLSTAKSNESKPVAIWVIAVITAAVIIFVLLLVLLLLLCYYRRAQLAKLVAKMRSSNGNGTKKSVGVGSGGTTTRGTKRPIGSGSADEGEGLYGDVTVTAETAVTHNRDRDRGGQSSQPTSGNTRDVATLVYDAPPVVVVDKPAVGIQTLPMSVVTAHAVVHHTYAPHASAGTQADICMDVDAVNEITANGYEPQPHEPELHTPRPVLPISVMYPSPSPNNHNLNVVNGSGNGNNEMAVGHQHQHQHQHQPLQTAMVMQPYPTHPNFNRQQPTVYAMPVPAMGYPVNYPVAANVPSGTYPAFASVMPSLQEAPQNPLANLRSQDPNRRWIQPPPEIEAYRNYRRLQQGQPPVNVQPIVTESGVTHGVRPAWTEGDEFRRLQMLWNEHNRQEEQYGMSMTMSNTLANSIVSVSSLSGSKAQS